MLGEEQVEHGFGGLGGWLGMAVVAEPGPRGGGVGHAGAHGRDQCAVSEVTVAALGGDRADGGDLGHLEGTFARQARMRVCQTSGSGP